MATYDELMAKAKELAADGRQDEARRVAEIALKSRQSAPKTNLVEQGMSGVNQGLAQFAAMPVDLMESAVNLGITGVNKATGANIPMLEGSIGGSKTTQAVMDPFVSDVEPQTAGQRYARRIGQEVGFGLPASLTGASLANKSAQVARAKLPQYLAASTTADVAAGTAGQTAREVAPESDVIDLVASILAGGGTAAMTGSQIKEARKPLMTTDEMFAEANRLGGKAKGANIALSPNAQERFVSTLDDALGKSRASPVRHPNAFSAVEDVRSGAMPSGTLSDIDDVRFVVGRDVAGTAAEAGVGVSLKDQIDDYLSTLKPGDMIGENADEALEAFAAKRKMAHQAHKARAIEGSQYRGTSRAATSGTGGNEVNTQRQNIRAILDNEVAPKRAGKRSGYTPDEIADMENVVFGSKARNAQRWAGRFSPTAGMLPGALAGGGLGTAVALGSGNPLAYAAAIPAAAGFIGKGLAERGTKKDIAQLLATVKNMGVRPDPQQSAAIAAIVAQLMGASGQGVPQ